MATLFNTKISATYEGLLKTIDNAAITATLKELTDGSGNQSGLFLNTAGDFKVNNILEWGLLKDTGTGVTITRFVTSTDGIENFDNNTSLPTTAAVKLYVDTKFATSDTLQEVLSFGNTTSGNDIVVSASDDITFTDSSKAIFGTGQDLEINHDGFDSFITDLGTGNLRLRSDDSVRIQASTGGNTLATFTKGAGVDLYFINNIKLATTNTGLSVTGVISNVTDPVAAQDAATKSYVDALDAGSDLDITDGTTAGAVNLNTQSLSILGTTNEIDSVVSGQSVTIGLPTSISTNLVGDVTGNLTGNVAGNLTGTVNATSILADGVTATTQASSDSSAKVATTAYVKGLNNASDLDFSGDSGTGAVILNTESLAITGTTNQIVTVANLTGLSLQFPTAGVTLPDGSIATTQAAGNNSTKVSTTAYVDTSAALYLPLAGGIMSGGTIHNDSVKSLYGTGSDAEIYHDGANFYAKNSTGQFNIDQGAVTESIVFKVSNNFALDTTALTLSRNGDIITGRDVTIAGDLTVNGTTTTVNSQTLSVVDPLIQLAKGNAANSLDIGFYGDYDDAGTARFLGMYSDASDSNKFKIFKGTTTEPTTTVDPSQAGYVLADLELANLVATGNVTGTTFIGNVTGDVTGDLTGNADTSTKIASITNSNIVQLTTTQTLTNKTLTSPTITGTGAIAGTFTGNLTGNVTGDLNGTADKVEVNNTAANQNQYILQANGDSGSKIVYADAGLLFNPVSHLLTVDGAATFAGDVGIGQTGNAKLEVLATSGEIFRADSSGGAYRLVVNQTGANIQGTLAVLGNITATTTIGTAKIIMQVDGTLDWGNAKDYGTLTWDTGYAIIAGQASKGLKLRTNDSADALTIDTSQNSTFAGNVGIGYAVQTNIKTYVYDNSADYGLVVQQDGAGIPFQVSSAGSLRMIVANNGNVGIGVTGTPNAPLEIVGNTRISRTTLSTTYQQIEVGDVNTTFNGQDPDGWMSYIFKSNGTTRFTIDGQNGNATFTGAIYASNNNPAYSFASDTNTGMSRTGTHQIGFINQGNTSLTLDALSRATFAGNVGISTTPSDWGWYIDKALQFSNGTFIAGRTDSTPALNMGTNSYVTATGGNAWRYYAAGKASRYFQQLGSHTFQTATDGAAAGDAITWATSMAIDSSGNVGIGTDSPTASGSGAGLDVSGMVVVRGTLASHQTNAGVLERSGDKIALRAYGATAGTGYLAFNTGGGGGSADTERMRITSGGDIQIKNGTVNGGEIKLTGADNDLTLNGARDQIIFQINGTSEYVMDANQLYPETDNANNLGTSGLRFSTVYAANGVSTSDKTLKENIEECDLGIDFINSLKPKSYNLKDLKEDNDAYGKKRYGLIAQDILQTELKDSVFGKKDGEYGLSYNDLIAPMIKAIQELKAEVDLLKSNKCNCKN